MRRRTTTDPGRAPRRGSLSVELLLALPVVMLLLLALIQFGLWFHVRQRLATAGRDGARVAALGGSSEDVRLAVFRSLGDGRIADEARVDAALTDSYGDPVDPGQAVAVRVAIPAIAVVPDLLRFVGLSHRDGQIVAQVVMRRE